MRRTVSTIADYWLSLVIRPDSTARCVRLWNRQAVKFSGRLHYGLIPVSPSVYSCVPLTQKMNSCKSQKFTWMLHTTKKLTDYERSKGQSQSRKTSQSAAKKYNITEHWVIRNLHVYTPGFNGIGAVQRSKAKDNEASRGQTQNVSYLTKRYSYEFHTWCRHIDATKVIISLSICLCHPSL